MKNVFDLNNSFWIELGKVWDYIVLNFLWIICSLPLISIGASTSAMYYTSLRLLSTGDGQIVQNFFHAFRSNFKQATLLWLVMCGLTAFAAFDIRLCMILSDLHPTLAAVALLMLSSLLLILVLGFSFLFPIQCWFENTSTQIFQKAIVLSIHHIGFSLLLLTVNALLLFISLCIPNAVILLPGTLAFIHGAIFKKIFRKYTNEE